MQLTWPCLWRSPSPSLSLSFTLSLSPYLVRVAVLGFCFVLCDLQQFSSVFDYENDLVVVVVVVLACVFDFFSVAARHTLRWFLMSRQYAEHKAGWFWFLLV